MIHPETGCGMKEEDAGQNIVIPEIHGRKVLLSLAERRRERQGIVPVQNRKSSYTGPWESVIKSFADKQFVFGRNMFQIRIA